MSVCPSDALTFDYRLKIAANAKKRLKAIVKDFPNACIYGLEEFGGLHVITILKDSPEKFGLERNPKPVKKKAHWKTERNSTGFFQDSHSECRRLNGQFIDCRNTLRHKLWPTVPSGLNNEKGRTHSGLPLTRKQKHRRGRVHVFDPS